LTDCAANNFSVTTAGATGTGKGATLAGNGDVDFTAAAVANYQINYTVCNSNGLQTAMTSAGT
jgi:hypothetical protein